MPLSKDQLRHLYGKRAALYDVTANLYYLIGFREVRYRRRAVSALALGPGDTVVEIGCGTGLNFPYLRESIGESGRIIGVDLTGAMLERARQRIHRHGWGNVELVQADAAQYEFPAGIQGVLSTFALTLVPEFEQVIAHAAGALNGGGKLVVADVKKPEGWPRWLVSLGIAITSPFGVSLDLAERRPWEVMERYFSRVTLREFFGGCVYIAAGEN